MSDTQPVKPSRHPSGRHPVYIVQGAQWGSEGKGQIAAAIVAKKQANTVIRTGSINAGHTVWHQGKEYKMQLLPTAWVIPGVQLVLGPGCYIHRAILAREIAMIREATGEDIRNRLKIDIRCTVHDPTAEVRGQQSPRHHEMGATGKGSSESIKDRLDARGDLTQANRLLFANDPRVKIPNSHLFYDLGACMFDTPRLVMERLLHGPVLIEGTQGAHLDLYLGPYPYVTNRAVSTAAWLAFAGLPPTLDIRPILVARTFPIRVAGNSGPMTGETGWTELYRRFLATEAGPQGTQPILEHGQIASVPCVSFGAMDRYEQELLTVLGEMGAPLQMPWTWGKDARYRFKAALSEAPSQAFKNLSETDQGDLAQFFEMTTVTKKIRRVAGWDARLIKEAILWNGCSELWVSFLNYRFPETWGQTSQAGMSSRAVAWLKAIEQELGVPICGVTTERFSETCVTLS